LAIHRGRGLLPALRSGARPGDHRGSLWPRLALADRRSVPLFLCDFGTTCAVPARQPDTGTHELGGRHLLRTLTAIAVGFTLSAPLAAQDIDAVAGKRVVFLGDSITQSGGSVRLVTYYLEKLHPSKDFDILGLGLARETLSGLSEDGHAGGKFPRPCLFERLDRLLEKARPEVVFACYGINDGIYQPLDGDRFAAFKKGVTKLIERCRGAGVKGVYLITPPIYDFTPKKNEFNYDSVLTAYAQWEAGLKVEGVRVIDLHTAVRKARDVRAEPFSKDRVHPGDDGHLLMARTVLAALGVKVPEEAVADVQKDPLYMLVGEKRALRLAQWMKHPRPRRWGRGRSDRSRPGTRPPAGARRPRLAGRRRAGGTG
jgi:lysophospholipase L1-like esterase